MAVCLLLFKDSNKYKDCNKYFIFFPRHLAKQAAPVALLLQANHVEVKKGTPKSELMSLS